MVETLISFAGPLAVGIAAWAFQKVEDLSTRLTTIEAENKGLRELLTSRFNNIDGRFDNVDDRLGRIEDRLE